MELMNLPDTASALEMKNAHKWMMKCFKNGICLKSYYGPVQMGVFELQYEYIPKEYKILVECERGFITITVYKDNLRFYPALLYKEADYFHFADKKKDVLQLITLTHRALTEDTIKFYSSEEIIKQYQTKK